VPTTRITDILRCRRGITGDTALRLAQYFGVSPDFWMNLQKLYELDLARQELGDRLTNIPRRVQAGYEEPHPDLAPVRQLRQSCHFRPAPTLEAPDDDPYLWLEEIDGERALAWVEAQNAATLTRFGDARFRCRSRRARRDLDRPDNIPIIARRGPRVFNFWKDAAHPRGLWRTTTLDSYRNERPEWDILLDLDALAAREGEDWTWSGASTIPGRS